MKKIIYIFAVFLTLNSYSQKRVFETKVNNSRTTKITIIDNAPENIYNNIIIIGSPKTQANAWGNDKYANSGESGCLLSFNPSYRRFDKNTKRMISINMEMEILDNRYGLMTKNFPPTSIEFVINNELHSYYKFKKRKHTLSQTGYYKWGKDITGKYGEQLHTKDHNVKFRICFKRSFDYRLGVNGKYFNYFISNKEYYKKEDYFEMKRSYFLSAFTGIAFRNFSYIDFKASSFGRFKSYFFNHFYLDIIFSPLQVYYGEKYQINKDDFYIKSDAKHYTYVSKPFKNKFFGYRLGIIFEKSRRLTDNGGQFFFEYESHPFFEDNIKMFSFGYRLTFVW